MDKPTTGETLMPPHPYTPCSTDLVSIVEKIALQQPLSDVEINYVIKTIFDIAITRHYKWITNMHVKMTANAMHQDAQEIDSANLIGMENPNDPTRGDTEEQDSIRLQAKKRLRNFVYQFATSELWARFANLRQDDEQTDVDNDPASGPKGIWEKAYSKFYANGSRPMEKDLCLYLRAIAWREINEWCAGNSIYALMRRRLTEALKDPRFDVVDYANNQTRTYFLAGALPATNQDASRRYNPDRLCEQIKFPPPKGQSRHHSEKLPTAGQITNVLLQLFALYPAPLSVSEIINFIQQGWKLSDIKTKPLEETREIGQSDEDSSGLDPENQEATYKTFHSDLTEEYQQPQKPHADAPPDGTSSMPKIFSQEEPSQHEQACKLASELEIAIEKAARIPLDTPLSPNPKPGEKLARMFLEFFLWQSNDVVTNNARANYVIAHYCEHTGYGSSQESKRWYEQLVPIISSIAKDSVRTNKMLLSDAILILKLKYLHWKPEFIDFAPFSDDETGGQHHESE